MMWPRKRLDIGWADLAFALASCLYRVNARSPLQSIESCWPGDGRGLACLSVRTGFDLVLEALALPPGAEVLVSALTIPDMVRIIERRGLVAVPVDLDPADLAPRAETIERAITSRTRALLVAHLFGSRFPMQPIVETARRHGLLVFEDCAQAWDGGGFQGHPDSDVAFFSFGTIKTATALGGALLHVRDAGLLAQLRELQARLPIQSRWRYATRLIKYALMHFFSGRIPYTLLVGLLRICGVDFDRMMNRAVRGFPGRDIFRQLRQRPSVPLLALLDRRIRSDIAPRLQARTLIGQRLAARLMPTVCCPAGNVPKHSYWVFPCLSNEPAPLIALLRRAGFDATQGHSMTCVPPPSDNFAPALVAARALETLVYLPCYPELPPAEVNRLADVVLAHVRGKEEGQS
jgi:perosamine synthetase